MYQMFQFEKQSKNNTLSFPSKFFTIKHKKAEGGQNITFIIDEGV